MAELRDLFIAVHTVRAQTADEASVVGRQALSAARSAARFDSESGAWTAIRNWIAAVAHPVQVDVWAREPTAVPVGNSQRGEVVHLSSRTDWLDLPVARQAYELVWRVKRFVGGSDACPSAQLLVVRTGCAAARAGTLAGGAAAAAAAVGGDDVDGDRADDDDFVRRQTRVRLLHATSAPDVRLWQLVCAIAQDGALLHGTGVTNEQRRFVPSL